MADRDKPRKSPPPERCCSAPLEQGPAVVLVHRPRYDDWSFPSGKCLPGEHVLITAVRGGDGGDRDRDQLSRRAAADRSDATVTA